MDGYWIRAVDLPNEPTLYRFSKTFYAELPLTFRANVCADTRYRLFVNGKYVCDGPCRGLRVERYYEQPDITPYLVEGENEITVDVLYLRPCDEILTSQLRDTYPALLFDGHIEKDGKTESFSSDESWKCVRVNNLHFIKYGFASMPPLESITGELTEMPVGVEVMYENCLGKMNWTDWGTNQKYLMKPRPIPTMKPGEKQPFRVVKKGKGFIELDTGKYTTAVPNLYFSGTKGNEAKIIYAECYVGKDGRKSDRADSENGYITGVNDTVIMTGKEQTLIPFWFRAFRYIRIEWQEDAEFNIDLERSGFCPYFYPLRETGSFECDNERYNEIWDISRNTVKCCAHEILVDCPYYEQQQYGMDSCLEMIFLLRMSNDGRIGKKLIESLASSQLDDGMLQANFPSITYQVIPSFSLFWIMSVREYLRSTGDLKLVRRMTGTMDKVLEGMNSFIDKDGLVGKTKYWHYTDWVDSWEYGVPTGGLEEPVTVLSLIYATALGIAAELCRKVGRNGLASEYEERKKAVNEAVIRNCYDEKAKMLRNTPSTNGFSQHTAVWAVLSDAVTGDEARDLLERAMTSDVDKCTFSMNYFVFRALEKTGLYKYAPEIMQGWETMLDEHCTTWCEKPGECRSECHGWSSAPIYEFTEMILGVFPTEDGFKRVRIRPTTDGLSSAKGSVPTPFGDIFVSWEKQNGKISLDVKKPDGITVEIEISGKNILTSKENEIHIEY